ncbi:MAG TPA: D-sedoheptulose 7-phosphate isomerase [Pedobacter sp.]|uniref:D-sedoheptulose-7-phosphate isomerase n=1 Tax=Pedobacter sp. TaxID=1411316 RepID=UPI002C0D0032|nr:D-sedoheptulose 7-phosphate isomerase [Pedobacter sp.]HMI01435.1 D-sedoheptulose 7-phosphate isomerase [Pedobacter sp.]
MESVALTQEKEILGDFIVSRIQESISVKNDLMQRGDLISMIEMISNKIIETFKADGKVLFCGNGGSAADAQHLAAEFSGRFYFDRPPLFAEALHVNTSYLTAVANDYSYDEVYARLIKAKGRDGDILIGISTSGNSENIIRAFRQAKLQGMLTIALTGDKGGKMKTEADLVINIPSNDTPRIQESHILVGHIICEIVEKELFQNKAND